MIFKKILFGSSCFVFVGSTGAAIDGGHTIAWFTLFISACLLALFAYANCDFNRDEREFDAWMKSLGNSND